MRKFAVGIGVSSRTWFPLLRGGLFGGIPSMMAAIPFFNASPWVLEAIAVGMFAWGYRKGRSSNWIQRFGDPFGGGSSGGGGASGSW